MTSASPVTRLRIVLTVDDFDAAVRLYRDVLGLTELADYSAETGRMLMLGGGSATVEIASVEHAAYVDGLEVGSVQGGSVRVAFEVADVPSAAEAAAAAGTTVIGPPTLMPWNSVNARLETPEALQLTLFSPGED
jgi:predicted enzyme related to lactoylglutathione lyase